MIQDILQIGLGLQSAARATPKKTKENSKKGLTLTQLHELYCNHTGGMPQENRSLEASRCTGVSARSCTTMMRSDCSNRPRLPPRAIKEILENPDFDREEALRQQIGLLQLRRSRLDNLICFARAFLTEGGDSIDFSAFDQL